MLSRVIVAIDAANARDPSYVDVDGVSKAAALVYGERMSAVLAEFEPAAGIALRIAARGQHIERWTIPRGSFAEGRIGYLSWRKALQHFHARRLAEIVTAAGFDAAMAERVGQIVRKERLSSDADVQALEDVACLVFLTHYLAPFAAAHDDEKLSGILAKTWRKMSTKAQQSVLASPPPQRILDLLAAGQAKLRPVA